MAINDIEIIPVGKAKNKIGQKFGRLTVLGRAKPDNPNRRQAYWWCECDCGNIIKVRGDSLHENTLSCGCYKKDVNKEQGKELARKYNSINGPKNKKDLVGQRFFHLLVTKDSGQQQKTGRYAPDRRRKAAKDPVRADERVLSAGQRAAGAGLQGPW